MVFFKRTRAKLEKKPEELTQTGSRPVWLMANSLFFMVYLHIGTSFRALIVNVRPWMSVLKSRGPIFRQFTINLKLTWRFCPKFKCIESFRYTAPNDQNRGNFQNSHFYTKRYSKNIWSLWNEHRFKLLSLRYPNDTRTLSKIYIFFVKLTMSENFSSWDCPLSSEPLSLKTTCLPFLYLLKV